MLHFGQAIPAKEEQADESRFKEEGHQTFNRQRCTKNITNIMRVISPVGSELEFHGQTCGHPQGEVNTKQFSPELGHVFIDFFAGNHISGFHDGKQKSQT